MEATATENGNNAAERFSSEELRLLCTVLRRTLCRCDFGAEVTCRFVADKPFLFASLLDGKNGTKARENALVKRDRLSRFATQLAKTRATIARLDCCLFRRLFSPSVVAPDAPMPRDITQEAAALRATHPRVSRVADGITDFFQRVLTILESSKVSSRNLSVGELWDVTAAGDTQPLVVVDTPSRLSNVEQQLIAIAQQNGALHYRMHVWFQAQNWLCVKRSIIDTLLIHGGGGAASASIQAERVERVAAKLTQLIIRHMKGGFLQAALENAEQDVSL